MVALPDMKQADVYASDILPNLSKGKTILFSHGLSVHFGLIKLHKDIDCIMVAPKGPGHMVRRLYVEGKGMPALIAVAPGSSKQAKPHALAWAKGIGSTKAGVLQTTFKEECETDLFGEQAVLCGGVTELIKAGFDTLTLRLPKLTADTTTTANDGKNDICDYVSLYGFDEDIQALFLDVQWNLTGRAILQNTQFITPYIKCKQYITETEDSTKALFDSFDRTKKTLFVAPTGTGKTTAAVAYAKHK
jgi:ketol-acid reductoisomerase